MTLAARRIATGVLLLLAIGTGLLAWMLRPAPAEPEFVGPMRSDYSLRDYTLVALDESGVETFSVSGPQLDRDPYTGHFTLSDPYFTFPQPDEDAQWEARSRDAWISAAADEVRLTRDVVILGAEAADGARMRVVGEQMTVYPEQERATSRELVTIVDRGSTMSGVGMAVEFATRHYQFDSRSRIRYVPNPR